MARFRQDVGRGSVTADDEPPVVIEDDDESGPLGYSSTEKPPASRRLNPQDSWRTILHTGTAPSARLYFSGDEWAPVNSPSAIISLQEKLIAAGLLDEDDVRIGYWDEKSAAAYRGVLSQANRRGVNAMTARKRR
jgi:hypothetical protein